MGNKINVLGTEYTLEYTSELKDCALVDAGGYTDRTSKKIVVRDIETLSIRDVEDVNIVKHEILMHELVHAFFFESGLAGYSDDETLVDWIATQLPKIAACYEKAISTSEV